MDHNVASETMAAQDYLLGRMSPGLREEFEEHYFDCPECASQLRLTAAFLDNTAALRGSWQPAPKPEVRPWTDRARAWFRLPSLVPAAVAACLALFSATQYRAVQLLQAPAAVATLPPLVGQARSGAQGDLIRLQPDTRLILVPLEISRYNEFPALRFDLRRAGQAATVLSLTQESSPNIVLRIAARDLPPGSWEVHLSGLAQGSVTAGIETFRFRIEHAAN